MNEDMIVKIVEKAFNSSIYASIVGIPSMRETHIGGRPEFYRQIKQELEKLFKEYNLSNE